MSGNGRSIPRLPAIQTATYEVMFEGRQTHGSESSSPANMGRLPKITRLLVLAHKIDVMIRSGEIRNWTEAARLAGVTRARMTQIANLLILAPDIQAALLSLPTVLEGLDPATERQLRPLLRDPDWQRQRLVFPLLRLPCKNLGHDVFRQRKPGDGAV